MRCCEVAYAQNARARVCMGVHVCVCVHVCEEIVLSRRVVLALWGVVSSLAVSRFASAEFRCLEHGCEIVGAYFGLVLPLPPTF